MGVLNTVSVLEIKARGSIKDVDVAKLRRGYDADGSIDAEEAEALFALNEACPVQDPAWADCFVETITDYIVNQAPPEGYVTAANARWLVDRISRSGRVATSTHLELLVTVLKAARWAPQSLARFALEQVEHAIRVGDGPLRAGRATPPGVVLETDVDLLRRILIGFESEGNLAVSRPEAEVLFAIDRATVAGDNDWTWRELFLKAIGGCAMAVSGHAPPPRERALARARQGRRGVDAGTHDAKRLLAEYRVQSTEERAILRLTQQKLEIVTNETFRALEAAWLAEELGSKPQTPNCRAVLALLERRREALDPKLRELWAQRGTGRA
jgi:hypothetical protein